VLGLAVVGLKVDGAKVVGAVLGLGEVGKGKSTHSKACGVVTARFGANSNFLPHRYIIYYAMPKKYIVIGAGWFGIRAVQAIESISSDSEIIVLQVGTK